MVYSGFTLPKPLSTENPTYDDETPQSPAQQPVSTDDGETSQLPVEDDMSSDAETLSISDFLMNVVTPDKMPQDVLLSLKKPIELHHKLSFYETHRLLCSLGKRDTSMELR